MGAIQPRILMWARETAGLSLEEAAHALGINPAKGHSAAERLYALETGEEEPSRPTLLKMAKAYRRPLVAFYLAEPPLKGNRGQDFRTLPGGERDNPELDALVRDIKARQGLIRSMLEDNDAAPVDFIGTVNVEYPIERLTADIRQRIGFSLEEFRAARNIDQAFAYLRAKIEGAGVFVLLLGNLGSHHTKIPVEVFRGFALADPLAPLVVINDLDAHPAWSFTALHELAHLWLGATGISGATDTHNIIEQYCNDVAGEILLPSSEVRELAKLATAGSLEHAALDISAFAEARRISKAMVSYKLLRTGIITRNLWTSLNGYFAEQWAQFRQNETERNRAAEGGPNYYLVRRHRVGPALLGLVRRSLDDGLITYTKASRVLGVKPRSVEPLLAGQGAR